MPTELIDKVKKIAADAQALAQALAPKAQNDSNITEAERKAIQKLVKASEEALSDANKKAKAKRNEDIKALQDLIGNLDLALATPGLDEATRDSLKDLRRRKRVQLLNLQNRVAVDFGGILTKTQIKKIEDVLKRARQDVARRKRAAGFISTLMQMADLALGIVSKVSGIG